MPELMAVDLRNGNERVLDAPPPGALDQRMALTGDGRYVIGAKNRSLVFVPIDGGDPFTIGPFPEALIATAVQWPTPAGRG